ncbi:hypothetical protein AAFF_G00422440 [Aldrovandia affinis]|uniref:G-protein coupled receptors family 1 profile domain-containing protein n=1 Tax=Aldrovandia affinis TaxID=143900 RepID=A0AAD7T6G8_9TELE|nr:hypothetical protein AAFF_G00422440 [Aldrovandia affinis]
MLGNDTFYDYDYNDTDNNVYITENENPMRRGLQHMYIGMYSIIILLGLPLNILVIYMISCKMDKTASTVWFLGLSVTDLVIVLFLPFQMVSTLDYLTWRFRGTMCKICSYVMYMNMHSTALMIALLSVDRCSSALASRMCCSRTVSKSMVLLSWFIGGLLSIPSLLFRSSRVTLSGVVCHDNYVSTDVERKVVFTRLIFGWLFPVIIIFVTSCLVSMKRDSFHIKASRSYRTIRVMIIAYFLCWGPYHTLMVMKLSFASFPKELFTVGLPISTVLAAFNSCINPIIYIFMGRSISMRWMENAFYSDRSTTSQAAPETRGREEVEATEDLIGIRKDP